MKKKLILIDGNALVHRAFHALPPTLTKKDGTLTNAAYGFTLVLLNVLKMFEPDYVVAAFDRKEKTFRHRFFDGYKATRIKAPDELYMQIPLIHKILEAFGIPIVSVKGIEADDIIGIIAKNVQPKGLESVIVTGDLDTLQLVDKNTRVFTLRKGTKDTVIYDEAAVEKRYGLKPNQMIDYKALRGDPSDNISGVAGIGEKTAVELLKKYKTLDGVYEHVEEISGAAGKKLSAGKEDAYLSYRLAKIETDASLDFNIDEAKFDGYDAQKVKNVLQDMEFFSLIKRLGLSDNDSAQEKKAARKRTTGSDNRKESQPDPPSGLSAAYHKLKRFAANDEKNIFVTIWEKPADKILRKSVFGCEVQYLAVKKSGQDVVVYDKSVKGGDVLIRDAIADLRDSPVVGFGTKQEREILGLHNLVLAYGDDIKVLAYLADGGRNSIALESLAGQSGIQMTYPSIMEAHAKAQQKLFAEAGEADEREKMVRAYLSETLEALEQIYPSLAAEIEKIADAQESDGVIPAPAQNKNGKTIYSLYKEIELPLVAVLAKMETTGIRLDAKKLKELEEDYQKKANRLKKKIFTLTGGTEFNLDSSQQLSKVFYETLKFSTEGIVRGKSGFYSTSSDALEILAQKYEVPRLVTGYRELTKLITTYITPLPGLVNKKTGRIHTEFNQEVTTTGRLSSSNPNLQNIPIRTSEGKEIRKAFVADKGWKIVSADYSQIELRVAAHYAADAAMIAAFADGKDIHTETAARVHGINPKDVTPEVRRTAKELNFGIIYGMGAYGFARAARIERKVALDFIKRYKQQFPHVFEYVERAKRSAFEKGYVETLFGRRRYIPEIQSGNWQMRASGERMAVNMPLQGTAADIMKLAMVKIYEHLEKNGLWDKVKMLLSVHDEILFEVREDYIKEFIPAARDIMENVVRLSVPLKVDVKTAPNWGEV